MHVANPDWAFIATDKAAQAEELEDLVAEIKSIIESGLCPEKTKVQRVWEAIQNAGY